MSLARDDVRPGPGVTRTGRLSEYLPVDVAKLREWFRRTQAESQRAIWDMTLFALPWLWRPNRPPLLWLAAEKDALVPIEQMRIGAGMLGSRVETIPGVGHAMMLDAGWQTVADRLVEWLRGLT